MVRFGRAAVVANERKSFRCAIYTRKSSEHGLEQDFNSLDAQREAAEAYIKSQAHEGWRLIKTQYNDGGLSGGTLERPALQSLLADIEARKIDIVVVYKVDRLTRSLADFAKLVELFEGHGVSFVSVTQQFNTTTSMGRLTLNVLLSFAQFEREVTSERNPRQDRRLQAQGIMGRWHGTPRLREPGQEALHRRGRGRARPYDLPALPGTQQYRTTNGRPSGARDRHQSPPTLGWADRWRHPLHQRPARLSAAQQPQGQHAAPLLVRNREVEDARRNGINGTSSTAFCPSFSYL